MNIFNKVNLNKVNHNLGSDQLIYNLGPIDRLLVMCVNIDVSDPDGNGVQSLRSACRSFDHWEDLFNRAEYQGVSAWAYEILSLISEDVPPGVLSEMRKKQLYKAALSAAMLPLQKEILSRLNEEQIPFIVLKGPSLAQHIYPRPELRSFTDIDLLVHGDDVDRAARVFEKLEYRLVGHGEESFFLQGSTQAHFYRDMALPIDLHWDLINLPHEGSIAVDVDEVWSASRVAELSGVPVRLLSKEDMLIFQCAHMTAHHDFNRLLWFKDVQQVANRLGGEIDWELFIDRACRYRLKTYLYYALVMSEALCGPLVVPADVIERLRPTYLLARIFERLLKRASILDMQGSKRRPALEVWRLMRDEPGKRLGALRHRFFPKVEWYLACYPFLPKIRHQWAYYGIYPGLMVLRLLRRPME